MLLFEERFRKILSYWKCYIFNNPTLLLKIRQKRISRGTAFQHHVQTSLSHTQGRVKLPETRKLCFEMHLCLPHLLTHPFQKWTRFVHFSGGSSSQFCQQNGCQKWKKQLFWERHVWELIRGLWVLSEQTIYSVVLINLIIESETSYLYLLPFTTACFQLLSDWLS